MVMHKILGVAQLAAISIISIYLFSDIVPKSYALGAVIFFISKGVLFTILKRNPLSSLDAISGFYLLFPVFGWFSSNVLNIIMIAFLAQKGIMYLLR